jgi:hypothetical protein
MLANMTRVRCARIIGAYDDALGNRDLANVSIEETRRTARIMAEPDNNEEPQK